jgi:thioredoxin reductase (NADPH)
MDMNVNPAIPAAALRAASSVETDAVIIGAGPVGLFQIFELGLLEIKAHVIDSLSQPGGQPIELYPDKPIYDIPAIPMCTGAELTSGLLKQAEPFKPTFHLGQEVSAVAKREDGRFDLITSTGTHFITKTVFIAGGVGAFTPRKPKVEGLTQFEENGQLAYRVRDPQLYAGKNVVILGGGDSALDWALNLQPIAESVTLIHRRDEFRAAPANVAKMKTLAANYEMMHITGQVTGFESDDGVLKEIKVTSLDGVTRRLPLDNLLAFFGLSPRLGPIAEWGLDIEKRQVKVDTEKFETSIPGIFAVGDISTYPGKKKLILSGFHEAALAAFGAAKYIFPNKTVKLQYTTTSTKLHEVLGVESPVFD